MKKEDTEMMLRIFETERAGYAYLYPSDGGERKEDYISTTAENIANYIGSHMFEAEKIVITDMCDSKSKIYFPWRKKVKNAACNIGKGIRACRSIKRNRAVLWDTDF